MDLIFNIGVLSFVGLLALKMFELTVSSYNEYIDKRENCMLVCGAFTGALTVLTIFSFITLFIGLVL